MTTPPVGRLVLIPVPIADTPVLEALPPATVAAVRPLRRFVVENARTARRILGAMGLECPVQALAIDVFDEHSDPATAPTLMAPLVAGESIGVMSEAGCPGIADPGAPLVRAAHRLGAVVVPLAGPSAILMALMASGLEGQRFAFHGYLPADAAARDAALTDLDRRARADSATQLCIETPYRTDALLAAAIRVLSPGTWLAIAVGLGDADGQVVSRTVEEWRRRPPAPWGKRPAVLLVGAQETPPRGLSARARRSRRP